MNVESLKKPYHQKLLAKMEMEDNKNLKHDNPRPKVGMMVSLDHTIYFHRPREIRADDWLCSEMESPWTGAERGLIFQRIWNRDGVLVASCVQEVSNDMPTLPILFSLLFLS